MNKQEINFYNLEKVLQQYGDLIVDTYKQKLVQKNINSTGQLSNTLNYIFEDAEGVYDISLDIQDYWKYVEDGRKAGRFPPVNAIRQWINIKRILPNGNTGKLPSINQLAYLIGRKIARQGVKGKNVLQETLDELNLSDAIEDAVTADVTNQVDDTLNIK